jgi:superoxide dismutase, Fe-Mn family
MLNRREALVQGGGVLSLLGAMATTSAQARAQTSAAPQPKRVLPVGVPLGKHQVVPLPFDAKKLKGLSEKLLTSHHDNNYAGAVTNLNKVEQMLAGLPKDAPGFEVAGLRERELVFSNSMVLHEHYFGNLGGNGKPLGAIMPALESTFSGRWEEMFRATGMSLAGGSGWAVLAYSFAWNGLRIVWSGNHSQVLAFSAPVLVMDMYEHAYQMDYGAAAAKYVDAFFANINWDEVNRRYERALSMARAG